MLVTFFKSVFLALILYVLSLGGVTQSAVAQTTSEQLEIQVLGRDDCQHCVDQKAFFDELLQTRDDFFVTYLDIYQPESELLFNQVTELEGLSKSTPVTIVGSTVIQGYATPETSGRRLEELIDQYTSNSELSRLSFSELVAAGGTSQLPEGSTEVKAEGVCDQDAEECIIKPEPLYVNVPFVGVTNVRDFSLPLLSLVLGFVDGFNPCAMWVLVTFLVILVQIGDRKKMWIYAGLFILAEAIMYYLILTVWYSTWNFIKLDQIVTPIVGLVAIGGGAFFLYEWWKSDGACMIIGAEKRVETRSKIKEIVAKPLTLATALGIVGLALSVNVIEFACSIGIPQAFTKVLEINQLSFVETNFYMLLYIMMYMVDDLIVFGLALFSFEKIGLTSKYSNWTNLIGGVLMLILGFILVFKPEWLVMLG